MAARDVILEDVSPDGRFHVAIGAPTASSSAYFATVRNWRGDSIGIPFGYDASPDALDVRWDLPDSVLGLFLEGECYLLFRWGPSRRRRRESYRLGRGSGFTDSEIEWFCAVKHVQPRPA